MTEKKTKSSKRNYQKARITGISFDFSVLTEAEQRFAIRILKTKHRLLAKWDTGTNEIIGTTLPSARCENTGCRRRLSAAYTVNGKNYCYKHYRELIADDLRYECSIEGCNKRMNARYAINGQLYCHKHYTEIKNQKGDDQIII